ncbi:MAG TPA: universal stress protein [Phycisphaerales bacterium]|nr:universal stress protein [Phycisphaerales bacterium]
MLVTQKRPRDLHWYHAGPLLFGDWGTSRLYVLGLAFYYTGHASVVYMAVMALIMAAVAWAYTIVCRSFPEGGGVYTAARQISPTLSVIGATLLLCDYIVTAALSAVEAFHYFGVPHHLTVVCCTVTILGIGVINWLGARSAARFALLVAIAAIVASALIGLMSLYLIPAGLRTVELSADHSHSWLDRWESLVRIVLALSGVEAVANMTGLMKEPVGRTSRRTIWPVLLEVIVLNMIFGIALNALPGPAQVATPDYITHEIVGHLQPESVPAAVRAYRDTAVKMLGIHVGSHWFGPGIGRIFGLLAAGIFALLLLSAVNTAIMAKVSVMYSMAHDRELPRPLSRLNYSGVPWVGLLVACGLPLVVLLFEADAKALGELYAIGVVGAITINFLCCASNRAIPMARWERAGLWALGLFMAVIEATICWAKPHALVFAATMIAVVLTVRFGMMAYARYKAGALRIPVPEEGWLAEIQREPLPVDPSRPRIMLAARGHGQAEFAVDLARRRGATLFVIYVRTLRVMDLAPGTVPQVEDDPQAVEALGSVAALARRYRVPVQPIYVCATDVVSEILDYTVTFGCDTLIMGKTRRRAFARALEGDVLTRIVQHLPSEVALITRDPSPHPMGPEPAAEVAGRAGAPGESLKDVPDADGGND